MDSMTKVERVQAAINGQDVDRLPIVFWHHFKPHGSPQALASATNTFFGRFDLDIYKIMPDIPYPFPNNGVRTADDWHMLSELDPHAGNFGRMVEATMRTRAQMPDDTPLIVTMFSPFCYAMNFAGRDHIKQHMAENPTVLHDALSTIAHNLAQFAHDLISHGSDGIFFASQGAGDGFATREQYLEFGVPYDLEVLRGARDGWLNILHIHGFQNLMVELFAHYPAAAFSWSDRISGRSLATMRSLAPNVCLMGGLNEQGPMIKGPVDQIAAEMRDAIAQTGGGRRLILANGCSVPDEAESFLSATRELASDMHQG